MNTLKKTKYAIKHSKCERQQQETQHQTTNAMQNNSNNKILAIDPEGQSMAIALQK